MLVLPNVIIEPLNVRKKKKKPSNVIKVKLHLTLVQHNVRIKSSNVRKKKIRESPNVTKVLLNVMLVLSNVTIKSSNVRKK